MIVGFVSDGFPKPFPLVRLDHVASCIVNPALAPWDLRAGPAPESCPIKKDLYLTISHHASPRGGFLLRWISKNMIALTVR
jgi:hypothetical protein